MMDGAVMPFPSQFAGLDLTWFDKSSMLRLKLRLAHHLASNLFHRITHRVSPWPPQGTAIVIEGLTNADQ